jgi:cytochrome c5
MGATPPAVPAVLRRLGIIAAGVVAITTPAMANAQPLDLGFSDDVYTSGDAALRDTWLQRTVDTGGSLVRLNNAWAAASRPEHPADPADPAYDWGSADAAVDAARARGLKVLVSFTGMPRWAQTKGAPKGVDGATWKPNARLIGQYGEALATHFAGRVNAFQVWNEPNLSKYLTPQWSNGKPAAPGIYRAMLDAFYAGVKRVHPKATVVTAGTAPFGDFGHGSRMMPMIFWRNVLKRSVSFDVLAHHPYSAGGPTRHALNSADVAIPDMGKLRRLLEHAHKRARLWATEVSYDSKPPDPDGVPTQTQARWLEHAFELLWRGGVDTITWLQVRDQAPVPSYAATNQSGVFLRDGTAKPSATAFRFPFVAGGNQVWTRAPLAGTLEIQRNGRTVKSLTVRAGQVLLLKLRTPPGSGLRGVIGGLHSLSWRV